MTIKQIKGLVERKFNVDLRDNSRKRHIVYARSLYFKLSRDLTLNSMASIGELVNRDHASVVHGVKLFDETLSKYEPTYERAYRKIKESLSADTLQEKMFKQEIDELKAEISLINDKIQEMSKNYLD